MTYFTVDEFAYSVTAMKYGIDNSIPAEILPRINQVIEALNPIREFFDAPIKITSGYRCPTLNFHPKIRGAAHSKHMSGLAADFRVKGYSIEEAFQLIIENFESTHYRTLIQEKNRWLHIDIGSGGCRNFRYVKNTYTVDDRYHQKSAKKHCFCF